MGYVRNITLPENPPLLAPRFGEGIDLYIGTKRLSAEADSRLVVILCSPW